MTTISQASMDQLAAGLRSANEVPMIMDSIRSHGGDAFDDATLEREVRATLARCEYLELTSDADRMTLCLLELLQFPGLRDVPKLRGLLNYAQGPAESRMASLFLVAPPSFWGALSDRAPVVRQERNWP